MLKLADGRKCLYQWDTNVKIAVDDNDIEVIEFKLVSSNDIIPVKVENGYAEIPNILLQSAQDVTAYASCIRDGQCTKEVSVFSVRKRPKPTDYVYTETEIKSYKNLEKRIINLEKNGGGGGSVTSVNGQTGNVIIDVPKKISELENDANYVKKSTTLSGYGITDGATKQEVKNLSEEIDRFGGTVEITSEYPEKENTVLALGPSSEYVNIYTAEETDVKLEQLAREFDDKLNSIQNGNEVAY